MTCPISFCFNIILEYGQIRLAPYQTGQINLIWPINSDCENIHIVSTLFKTSSTWDQVMIDGVPYSLEQEVNQIAPNNVTVSFTTGPGTGGEGFILNWNCANLSWSAWSQVSDGTCNQERRRTSNGIPEVSFGQETEMALGPNAEYRETNTTCGE